MIIKSFVSACCMVLLATFMSVSVAASDRPDGWGIHLTDSVKLKSIQDSLKTKSPLSSEQTERFIKCIDFQLAVLNQKLTYDQLKKISIEKTGSLTWVPSLILFNKQFQQFASDIFNDVQSYSKPAQYTIKTLIAINLFKNDPKGFREYFITSGYFTKIANFTHWCMWFAEFEKLSSKYSVDELKTDLAAIKRYTYPKIENDSKWKPIVVKLELLKKSLE